MSGMGQLHRAALIGVVLACQVTSAFAQSPVAADVKPAELQSADVLPGEAPLTDIGFEQRGIDARREREMARLDAASAACFQRFAVNDCLKQVQVERRAELAELRRRQTVLDAATRLQRSEHALQDRERKLAEQATEQAALAEGAAQAQLQAQERVANQQSKVSAHRAIGTTANGATAANGASSAPVSAAGPSAPERAKNRAAYEQRQAELAAHRLDVEKNLKAHPQRPALPASAAASGANLPPLATPPSPK